MTVIVENWRAPLSMLWVFRFITIGHGATVDEDAFITALQSGHLGGAALDVFSEELLSNTRLT